ncbi:MAG: helix-turn-helix domain-containing protein [Pirellulaceae bacterium]
MQYSFRLAELLGHVPDPRRRPGTIKAIVEYTGLDRHQVAALLKNEVKYIPLKALSRLCDYLIEHGYASADQLPGALFAVEPENFWELLARRRRLVMCLGVRRDVEQQNPDVSYVVASDSVLMGEILNGVTTLGGTAKLKKLESASDGSASGSFPHPEHLKQMLVWSPGQTSENETREQSNQSYREFSESSGDKALVCLGSTKSNSVVEIVMANAFGCDPFVSQDSVEKAQDRSCPVYFRYRDTDPHPASCIGGLQLAKGSQDVAPGIWYEQADGQWVQANAGKRSQHVAMVFYIHRESQGRLEMALGGFSGRATRLLARALATRAEDFWPPTYNGQGIAVGLFLVEFNVGSEKEDDILRTDLVATTKVTSVPAEAIERRLEGQGKP